MTTRSPPSADPARRIRDARDGTRAFPDLRALELEIIAAPDLEALYTRLESGLRQDDAEASLRITLADPRGVIGALLESMLAVRGPEQPRARDVRTLAWPAELERLRAFGSRPRLLQHDAGVPGFLVPAPRSLHRSLAILPLLRGESITGALTVASRDPDRFQPGVTTDFLVGFGAVLGLCIENLVNRQRLETLSTTDTLTGLRNRQFLDARIEEEVARCDRSGASVSLVLLRVDQLDSLNDRLGHGVADVVLQALARRLATVVRRADVACRYAGAELAVLMPDTDADRALEVAERVRLAVATTPFPVPTGPRLQITVSGGLATHARAPSPAIVHAGRQTLCRHAAAALRLATERGRNRIAVKERESTA